MSSMFKMSCSIQNNIFKNTEDKLGAKCTIMNDDDSRIGDFSINVKNVDGENKVDFGVSKDLISNLIVKNIDLGSLFGGFDKLI